MPKTNKPSWFSMSADAGVGTIKIYGDIGGWGVTFQDFSRQLESLGLGSNDTINLTINSDGGDVYQGFAIYNALAMHPATKNITVMGLAASMASVIVMAGDSRIMPKNSALMIHNPVGQIAGESDEIISFGEAVGKMQDRIAQAYADASGGKLSAKKAAQLMDKQTWLSAAEALAYGLATEVIGEVQMAAHVKTRWTANGQFVLPKSSAKESKMTDKNLTASDFEGVDAETLAAIRKDEGERIKKRANEIAALCRIAGKPDLAASFIDDESKTPADVVAALDELRAKESEKPAKGKPGARAQGSDEISARHRMDTGDSVKPVLDSVDVWDRYNKRGQYAAH